jgi:hypothetical protein
MRRALGRFQVRHLVYSWLAYWTALAVWSLSPAAVVLGQLSRDGAHGEASAGITDGLLNLSVTAAGATKWSASISLLSVALAIAVPPILLWAAWLFAASSQPVQRTGGEALLESGDDVFSKGTPFGRRASGDAVRRGEHHTPT